MPPYDPEHWLPTLRKYMPPGTAPATLQADAELVLQALLHVRAKLGVPLSLVSGRHVPDPPAPGRRARRGKTAYESFPLEQLPAIADQVNHWVRDESRHPTIPGLGQPDPLAWLAVSGMPLIQTDSLPGQLSTTLFIVGSIYHRTTFEKVDHTADVALYRAIVREVRRLVRPHPPGRKSGR